MWLPENFQVVSSWILIEFQNSVGFNYTQIEFRLNWDWIWDSKSESIFWQFQNRKSWITFARRKIKGCWIIQGRRAEHEKSKSALKNTFYFSTYNSRLLTHTHTHIVCLCGLVAFFLVGPRGVRSGSNHQGCSIARFMNRGQCSNGWKRGVGGHGSSPKLLRFQGNKRDGKWMSEKSGSRRKLDESMKLYLQVIGRYSEGKRARGTNIALTFQKKQRCWTLGTCGTWNWTWGGFVETFFFFWRFDITTRCSHARFTGMGLMNNDI